MRIDEVLTKNALRGLRDTRVQAYLDQATDFLAAAYVGDIWLNSPTLRHDFARECYERSEALGIRRRRAHLRFLSHSVICGFAFEHSPIHRDALRRAGWLTGQGKFCHAPDMEALTPFVDRWCAIGEQECSQPDIALSACRDVARYGRALSHDDILAVLREAWPDRSAITAGPDLEEFADFVLKNVSAQKMPADISAIFVILSLHLGAFFFRDARYRALARAFLYTDAGEATRRDAVAEVIRRLEEPA